MKFKHTRQANKGNKSQARKLAKTLHKQQKQLHQHPSNSLDHMVLVHEISRTMYQLHTLGV
jgi:hypothetical protein